MSDHFGKYPVIYVIFDRGLICSYEDILKNYRINIHKICNCYAKDVEKTKR